MCEDNTNAYYVACIHACLFVCMYVRAYMKREFVYVCVAQWG